MKFLRYIIRKFVSGASHIYIFFLNTARKAKKVFKSKVVKYNITKTVKSIKGTEINNKSSSKRTSDINFERVLELLNMPFRKITIRTRLLVSFSSMSLIILATTSYLSYTKSSEAIKSKISTYSIEITNQVGDTIERDLDKLSKFMNEMSTEPSFQDPVDKMTRATNDYFYKQQMSRDLSNYITQRIATLGQSVEYMRVVAKGAEDLPVYYGNTTVLSEEDIQKYVKSTEESQNVNNFDFFVYRKDGKTCYLTITKRVVSIKSGNTLGYIICVLRDNYIISQYENLNLGEGTDIFMLNEDGIVVATDDKTITTGKEFVNKELFEKLKLSNNDKKYFFQDSINGEEYLITYTYLDKYDWYLVSNIPYSYLNKETNSLLKTMAIIFVFCFMFTIMLSLLITQSIAFPLKNLVVLMKKNRDGYLTIGEEDSNRDEISVVANNFNEMIANIRKLVIKGDESSRKVLTTSEEIKSSANKSRGLSLNIASTMEQIAAGSSSQAIDLSNVVDNVDRLYEGVKKVEAEMLNVSSIANNTHMISEQALVTVDELKNRSTETGEVTNRIITDIKGLNNDMKEIKKIIKLILDISKQTKLLALNATIEAAKAGDSGKGFAVVASEIRKLANRTKDSSIVINNILNTIQDKTESTVNYANSASHIIELQLAAVIKTDNVFNTIVEGMIKILNQIDGVESSVGDIVVSNEMTKSKLKNISVVTEEAAATSQHVSANTFEQSIGAEEILSYAKQLNELAIELNETMSVFKVDVEDK